MALQAIARQKPNRTLKDLSDAERTMVEVLLTDLHQMGEAEMESGYTEDDVQALFSVSKQSLSAWRAHRTMGH